jgi:hypothetical protein
MTIPDFDCSVIYGFHEGLRQWHIASIVPLNFTANQSALLTSINQMTVNMAMPVHVKTFHRGEEIPLFIPEKHCWVEIEQFPG